MPPHPELSMGIERFARKGVAVLLASSLVAFAANAPEEEIRLQATPPLEIETERSISAPQPDEAEVPTTAPEAKAEVPVATTLPSDERSSGQRTSRSGSRLSFEPGTYLGEFEATCYALRGTTASGAPAGPEGIAVDPRVIPLGTSLVVSEVGSVRATDTGGKIKGNRIDIWKSSADACRAFGRQTLQVWVAKGEVAPPKSTPSATISETTTTTEQPTTTTSEPETTTTTEQPPSTTTTTEQPPEQTTTTTEPKPDPPETGPEEPTVPPPDQP